MKLHLELACALLLGLGAIGPTAAQEDAAGSLDKQLVYFCSSGSQIADTSAYVGGYFECNWEPGSADRIAHVRLPTVLYVGDSLMYQNGNAYSVRPDGEQRLSEFFGTLNTVGVLDFVRVLYVVDEPNVHELSEADVRTLQQNARKAAARFPAMRSVRLATIYADRGSYPALDGFDIVACDNYGAGLGIFSRGGCYDRLTRQLDALGASQKTWYVVGGTDGEGRADPGPWVAQCKRDARCETIIAFSYFDLQHDDGRIARGIGQNGLAEIYCRAGMSLSHPEIAHPDCAGSRPVANLTVNGQKQVSVVAGRDNLRYRWWAGGRRGIDWWSYWRSSSTDCGWGVLSGGWEALDAGNESEWPAMAEQAGCAYEVTYVACEASGCSWDTVSVAIAHPEPPTAELEVNGEHDVDVPVGGTLEYQWLCTNAVSCTSTWETDSRACGLDNATGGPWKAMNANGEWSETAMSFQAECAYRMTYTAVGYDGASAAATIVVHVHSTDAQGRVVACPVWERTTRAFTGQQGRTYPEGNVLYTSGKGKC